MGQCVSRHVAFQTDDAYLDTEYDDDSLDEFWDACSQVSDVGELTPLKTDSCLVERALEVALEYQKNAKVLKARECLLNVADISYWERLEDKRVSRIFENASLVSLALQDIHLEEGYSLSREKPMRILYSHEKDGTSHRIKIKSLIKHPLVRVVSIPYEWDLLPMWNKYALDAVSYGSDHPHETVVYGASWMIPPFKDFHAIFRATGFDVSEENDCLVIIVQDCEHLANDLRLPPRAENRRIVNFLDGGYIVLKPVFHEDTVHTDVVLSVHLDPHIRGIPSSIVNFVLHVFAPYLFKQINTTLDTLFHEGSVYSKRIEESPHIYQLIHDAVESLRPDGTLHPDTT